MSDFSPAPRNAIGRFKNRRPSSRNFPGALYRFVRKFRSPSGAPLNFLRAINNPVALAANRSRTSVTWIGHASFLLQVGGLNILTDPVFSEQLVWNDLLCSRRVAPLGLAFEDLPKIDLVLISHNHYDHLDPPFVEKLVSEHDPQFIVPLGLEKWFKRRRVRNVHPLDWWESTTCAGAKVTAVPAQHYSGRNGFDYNLSLWCGFVLQHEAQRIYFAGDTGYCGHFKEIGERFEEIDLALIPIGAYDPQDYMRAVHLNPEEAVQVHLDVRSRLSVAMHWGTFRMTLEPLDQPPIRLKAEMARRALNPSAFRVLQHGESL